MTAKQERIQTLSEDRVHGDADTEVMSNGRLFQMPAPQTGKARLQSVLRRKVGTVKRLEDADLSFCRLGTSVTRVKIRRQVTNWRAVVK